MDDANHVSFRSDWLFDIGDNSSLRLFFQYFDAYNNLGAVYNFKKDYDKAYQNIQKAISFDLVGELY